MSSKAALIAFLTMGSNRATTLALTLRSPTRSSLLTMSLTKPSDGFRSSSLTKSVILLFSMQH